MQGSLAVDFRSDTDDTLFGPQATSTKDLPDAEMWARRMIMAVLEAYDGTRSADQLVRWLTPEIRERAQRRGRLARRRGRRPVRPPHIRALLTCQPADGVCEVSAAVSIHGRVRALALRMSGVDGRWLITAWELG
ncbi:Rv3235 family protein [Ornithinimicrobium panacihumi]|uniref:Rv3235 family protein n=1 Tax=Ornithinimicrobium panacihumi TaxID=2008449 RepID=UPI003F88691B